MESVTSELYELGGMPGALVGRPVVDVDARMIGIVRSIRLTIPPFRMELMVKGLDVEIPIDVTNVAKVGSVVGLKSAIKTMEAIEIEDVSRLRRQLREEIAGKLQPP